jgi:Protein of unknown function (DUF559)
MPSMGRSPVVPVELTKGAFSLEAARRLGMSKQQLRGAAWRRLGSGMYAWREICEDPLVALTAVASRIPPEGLFSGRTAAWIHGLDVRMLPIEVTLPARSRVSRISGVTVRRSDVGTGEKSTRRGLRVTAPLRTCADLGRRESLVEAVVVLDMATHARWVTVQQLRLWAAAHAGYRGVHRLKRAIELVEPATESPMETRLRLLIVQAGLPEPKVQFPLYDGQGQFLGRPDLYYPLQRLAIEYDGTGHRESLAADNRRQNRLIDAGYRILRFTAGDLLNTPESVVRLVRASLDVKSTRLASDAE